jgi:hypothetical protein
MAEQNREQEADPKAETYEAPKLEDLETSEGPSVTAALVNTNTVAAPRQL